MVSFVHCNPCENHIDISKKYLKEAKKSYFTHYSCMVIFLFNKALCRSAFSFGKLVFCLCASCVSFFKSNALNQDIKMCYHAI